MLLHVTRDGQQFGPYTLDQVRAYVASGQLLVTDLAWFDGAADWMPLHTVPGLSFGPRTPPPPPPSSKLPAAPAIQPGGVTRTMPARMPQGSCACPQCGGSQTMKLALAHAQGTTTSVFGGLSQSGGHTGAFGGAVVNQTALAQQLSPPKKPPPVGCSCGGCLAAAILGLFCYLLMWTLIEGATGGLALFCWLTLIGSPLLISWFVRKDRAEKMPEYERALAEYEQAVAERERSWVCLQCGRIYAP